MKKLTALEESILITIFRLKDDAYSVSIHRKLFEMTGSDMIIGSLYNVLDQLSKKGYLNKKRGYPVSERGGKSKMYYSVSKDGLKALDETRKLHTKLWNGLPDILYN